MSISPTAIAAALKAVTEHQRILVVPHANVDPDGLSSALACYQVFQGLGKDVTVICPDTPPESLKFLPGFEKLEREITESQNFVITVNMEEGVEIDKLRYTVEDRRVNIIVVPKRGKVKSSAVAFGEGEKKYDLIVVVDSADLALLGSVYTDHMDLFSEVPVLNIDHHVSNVRYGQIHLLDPTSASTTEILYQWFMQVPQFRERMTPDLATLLLTGLITDTRSFQNPNTTPRSLEVAADLLERGARQQEIIQSIYKTKPLSTLKIWGRALNRIQMDAAAGIVWSAVSREDLQEMGAQPPETHGILDELISTIPGADVYVLFTETEEGPSPGATGVRGGSLKASMRSSLAIDATRLAAETYGGGGHARAAGFRVRGFGNYQLQVLECIQKLKEGMRRQRGESDQLPASSGQPSVVSSQKSAVSGQGPAISDQTGTPPAQSVAPPLIGKGKEKDIVEELTQS